MNVKKIPIWVWIVVPVVVLLLCCGIVSLSAAFRDDKPILSVPTTEQPFNDAQPTQDVQPVIQTTPPPPPVRESATVNGSGNSLKQLGITLNGMYQVDYTGSSICLIVNFLKADGSSGAGFMQDINECNADGQLSGTTLVKMTDVAMVQIENTRGAWTLSFAPVG